MTSRAVRPALTCLFLLLFLLPLQAAGVRLASFDADWLERGDSDGLALTTDGRLFLAPELSAVTDKPLERTQQIFALATDRNGNLLAATGPSGRVIRITRSGTQSLFFQADEPLVTALATDRSGNLFAATAPGGTIYRIDADGQASRFSETGERYVFALVFTEDGRLYAGTGERGAVLAIDDDGEARLFFDSDEDHIVSLAAGPDGTLIAGGSGRGGLYLIDADGNAMTLYQDELAQIVAATVLADGRIVAAAMAAPDRDLRPPAVRLRLPGAVRLDQPGEGLAGVEESSGATIRGEIEGIATSPTAAATATIGRVVRIDPDGTVENLWSSSAETPFSLLATNDGVLFGAGEPARLYRIERDDRVSRLATLGPSQLAQLLAVGRSVFLGTSNPATLHRIETTRSQPGVFVSPAFDAGAPARWGSIGWRGGGGRAELYTRTGNSRTPDATWSAWSPALLRADGNSIVNPDGRYLQWRARMLGDSDPSAALSDVAVRYEPYNRAPEIKEFLLDGPGNARSGAARWSIAVRDADGDALTVQLAARAKGESAWSTIATKISAARADAEWRTIELEVELGEMAEGSWEVRSSVDDATSNPQGEARRIDSLGESRLTVDRRPPLIELRSSAPVEILVRDTLSPVARVELLHDGVVQHTLRAVDGVSDSGEELFRLEAPPAGSGWSLRGVDAAGNTTDLELPPG